MAAKRKLKTVVIARKHLLNLLILRARKQKKNEKRTVHTTQAHMISDILV